MGLPGYWTENACAGGLPAYWMDDRTGGLRLAVEAFLRDDDLTAAQLRAIRNYLRQWINAEVWEQGQVAGPDIRALRDSVDTLATKADIDRWLELAVEGEIDPL